MDTDASTKDFNAGGAGSFPTEIAGVSAVLIDRKTLLGMRRARLTRHITGINSIFSIITVVKDLLFIPCPDQVPVRVRGTKFHGMQNRGLGLL
jgi:hypothetical protein